MGLVVKLISFGFLLCLASCAPYVDEVPLTQLEVRVIQTREFDTADLKLVMKTMMNVLQDDGYMIKNAVSDLGLLCADKQLNIENKAQALLAACAAGEKARWCKYQIMEVSANVSEFGTQTRVRVNFQIKTFDNMGCVMEIEDVREAEVYREFFAKVNKGIFLQQEGL